MYVKCRAILAIGYLMSGISSCNSNASRQESKPVSSELPDSTALIANQKQAKDSVRVNDFECVRGQAEPIIKKKQFPKTTFVLLPDSLTGVETVSFRNGDKLVIKN